MHACTCGLTEEVAKICACMYMWTSRGRWPRHVHACTCGLTGEEAKTCARMQRGCAIREKEEGGEE